MRTISKIICWIFLVIALFIIVNLVIWSVQYWWTKNYSQYLNNKNWDEVIAQVYILKPITWLTPFYEVGYVNVETNKKVNDNAENANLNETLSWDKETEVQEVNHNPYDPDYEDEFNSFFGTNSESTWEKISVQEIENIEDLWDAWFKVDDSTQD